MSIPLSALLPIDNPQDYKIHLASWDGKNQPLDVFVRDRDEWHGWNSWRSSQDVFNRPYILSLIDFYSEPGIWLFGGIYEVLARNPVSYAHSYTVEAVQSYDDLLGRLKIRFARPGRGRALMFEKYVATMTVAELLKEPYTGERFPGYENINHDFLTLEPIFRMQRPDWKAALENVKGVYAIFDRSNGRKYVGSAYGEHGIWSRWSAYLGTGHGWTDELTKLVDERGIGYAQKNFRFVLLEFRSARTDDKLIIERENFWKEALISRGDHGYNRN